MRSWQLWLVCLFLLVGVLNCGPAPQSGTDGGTVTEQVSVTDAAIEASPPEQKPEQGSKRDSETKETGWKEAGPERSPETPLCPKGETQCDGQCVDTQSDTIHCGGCKMVCPVGEVCLQGQCKSPCQKPKTLCGGACIDTTNNTSHCGQCEKACAKGESCQKGQCQSPCQGAQRLCGTPAACVETTTSTAHCGACDKACPAAQGCVKGQCVCPAGASLCGGKCVDTASSITHCGACGRSCKSGQICKQGRCESACQSNQKLCGTPARCVDVSTDSENCGSCGKVCAAGESCQKGQCGVLCSTGQKLCKSVCINVQTNSQNCGACGKICGSDQRCEKGQCVCPQGERLCGGKCVNTTSSLTNCGACGKACNRGQLCDTGRCTSTCRSPKRTCGGLCTDVQSDRKHCGACGKVCARGQNCTSGRCQCPTDMSLCGGQCVDPKADAQHCGKCGTLCRKGQSCVSGRCEIVCPQGQIACHGICVDTKSTTTHCGACGNRCGTGQSCSQGLCRCPAGQQLCRGTCVDVTASTRDCGQCDNACGKGQVCAAKQCRCPSGQNLCAGSCVDLKTSTNHCNKCGTVCANGKLCSGGQCACPAGELQCGGQCIDPSTDTANCGKCGTSCGKSQVCIGGSCQCPKGQTLCHGICVDTNSDNRHCGKCKNVCAVGSVCNTGQCKTTCAAPLKACGGVCVNQQSEATHCGKCNNQCTGGSTCIKGACACPTGQTACGGACIDTKSSALHCGKCGQACAGGQACVQGKCMQQCTVSTLFNTINPSNKKPIRTVALSPNGKLLATGSTDGHIRVWDVSKPATPKLLKTLTTASKGHRANVSALAFSPDGKTLASGSWDNSIKLWNVGVLSNITLRKTLTGPKNYILGLTYRPDGQILFASSRDSNITLWDTSNPANLPSTPVTTLTDHTRSVYSTAVSPDGKTLYSASIDRTINVWDVAVPKNAKRVMTLNSTRHGGHNGYVYILRMSPDGRTLASSSRDKSIKLWDLANPRAPKLVKTLKGHTELIIGLSFDPTGTRLASGSFDNTVKLWNVRNPKFAVLEKTLKEHTDNVWNLVYSPEGRYVYSGSDDLTVKVWGCCGNQQNYCSGNCIATQQDGKNCGACGTVCSTNQICAQGSCQSCPSGTSPYRGSCVNIATNRSHCGRFGRQCTNGQRCIKGKCTGSSSNTTNFAQMRIGSLRLPTCSYTKVSGIGSSTIYDIKCGSLSVIKMKGTISSIFRYDLVSVDSYTPTQLLNQWLNTILKGNQSTNRFSQVLGYLTKGVPLTKVRLGLKSNQTFYLTGSIDFSAGASTTVGKGLKAIDGFLKKYIGNGYNSPMPYDIVFRYTGGSGSVRMSVTPYTGCVGKTISSKIGTKFNFNQATLFVQIDAGKGDAALTAGMEGKSYIKLTSKDPWLLFKPGFDIKFQAGSASLTVTGTIDGACSATCAGTCSCSSCNDDWHPLGLTDQFSLKNGTLEFGVALTGPATPVINLSFDAVIGKGSAALSGTFLGSFDISKKQLGLQIDMPKVKLQPMLELIAGNVGLSGIPTDFHVKNFKYSYAMSPTGMTINHKGNTVTIPTGVRSTGDLDYSGFSGSLNVNMKNGSVPSLDSLKNGSALFAVVGPPAGTFSFSFDVSNLLDDVEKQPLLNAIRDLVRKTFFVDKVTCALKKTNTGTFAASGSVGFSFMNKDYDLSVSVAQTFNPRQLAEAIAKKIDSLVNIDFKAFYDNVKNALSKAGKAINNAAKETWTGISNFFTGKINPKLSCSSKQGYSSAPGCYVRIYKSKTVTARSSATKTAGQVCSNSGGFPGRGNALEKKCSFRKICVNPATCGGCWKVRRGNTLQLNCKGGFNGSTGPQGGSYIFILSASYGNVGVVPRTNLPTPANLSCGINSACHKTNSLQVVKSLCQGKKQCNITASDTTFGGAAPGCTTTGLSVEYLCTDCPHGNYRASNSSICLPCAAGKFSPSPNMNKCQQCQEGSYQDKTGQSACTLCPVGSYQDKQGQASCIACPAGKASSVAGAKSSSTCEPCKAGRYQDKAGQSACKLCPVGSYQGKTGKTSCHTCPGGKTTFGKGATSIKNCR